MDSRYNASFAFYRFSDDEADFVSPLVGAMEKAMTFKLGEMGMIEEDIEVGCSLHPNFNLRCPDCRQVFTERKKIRPFFLKFPQRAGEPYLLVIPLGLLPHLVTRNYPLPQPIYNHILIVLNEMEQRRKEAVIDPEVRSVPPTVKLRAEHVEAIKKALQEWRCIIRGIPGAGKTWVAIGLLSSLAPHLRVCWLTHTNALLQQTASRLRIAFNEPIGLIGEGDYNLRARLTVAMFQSLHRKMKENDPAIKSFLESVDVLIIDEFHHTAATTFFRVTQGFTRAYLRWGLSATPYREITKENYFLIGALTPKVVTIGISPVPIKLTVYEMYGSVKVPPATGMPSVDYQRQYEALVVNNPARNRIIADEAIKHRPAVILIQRIAHGELLKNLIEKYAAERGIDVKVAFVHGELSGAERNAALQAYEKGEIDILILSDVGKEGLSLGRMKTLINAAGQKSRVALVQRIGRGLHPKGKEEVRVVEFIDAGGIPRQHSLRRIKTILTEFVVTEKVTKHWRQAMSES